MPKAADFRLQGFAGTSHKRGTEAEVAIVKDIGVRVIGQIAKRSDPQ